MLRSLASRCTPLALLVCVAALGTSVSVQATAATGDVLSLEWHTQQSSGGQVSQAAGFTAYSPTSSTAPAGARFSLPNTLKSVIVAPPTGGRFAAGQTYDAATSATATAAQLLISREVFSTSLCPRSTASTFGGTLTVLAAQYDDTGALTELAADYQGTCTLTNTGAQETVAGSVRHNTSTPWLALKPAYTPDTVATGRERVSPVTVTATASGKTIQLGQATISGARAADYQVSDNGCAGKTLGDGDACQVDVLFKPLTVTNGNSLRVARLSLAATGHVSDTVRVRLDSSSTDLPAAPENLTTYPTANAVGVSWDDGYPVAQEYRLERRLAGETDWTTVATIAYDGLYNYVDKDTQPGQTVEFRVTGFNAGWPGDSRTTSTTRPASVPAPGPDSRVAYGSNDAAAGSAAIVDGVDGGTVTASGSRLPTIQATAGPTGTGSAPAQVTYRVPMVPGPGEYRSVPRGGPSFGDSSYNCSYADSVLEVRSVAYDETRTPVVFDGSWVGRCPSGTVVRIEIRLGVDTGQARITTDPATVGRLTTYGGKSVTRAVTVSNHGPEDVTLGAATLSGVAAGDWQVSDNGCDTVVLHPGDTCPVTLSFATTAARARPAVLELAAGDVTGDLAPVTVALDGFGATPPAAPSGSGRGTVGAVLLWWLSPQDDGGLPIQSYAVERRPAGSTEWTALADVPAGPHPSFVDQTVGTDAFDYRVRAVNEVGPGVWSALGAPGTTAGKRAVVVSGSTGTTGPRGLFQVDGDQSTAPFIALTHDPQHDFRDPATSPAGSRLAVSRSAGDGTDGEYDLWSGTLATPTARQLTSMPGAERDPSYSPDASRIAFTHVAPDGSRSVWVVPALGGDPSQVRADAADPVWMPDGKSLLVEDHSSTDAPLLVVDVGTGTGSPLAGTDAGTQPAVSRAGDVAYVDALGRVLKIAAGQTMPQVAATPPYSSVLGSPAFDDYGKLYYDVTRTDTGRTAGSLNSLLGVVGEPAPLLEDQEAPWFTPAGLTDFVRGRADVDVRYGDQETPAVALHPQCRLDGAGWQPCGGPASYPDLAEGRHVLSIKLADEAAHTTRTDYPFVSDTVPPTLKMSGPSLTQVLGGRVEFSWDGVDAASGPAFYDVSVRTATPSTGFTSFHLPKGWSSTDNYNDLQTGVAVGQELCVRVRVRDGSGLWGGYVTRCVARPVDDASLEASRGWHRVKMTGLFQATETDTSRKGVTLRTTSTVTTRRIGVLATTCPTCGSVKVYVGTRYVGTVSLRSSRTRNQRLLRLPALPQAVTGRVVLKTASAKVVRIDGLSLARS